MLFQSSSSSWATKLNENRPQNPLADFKATTESEIHIPVVYRSVILLSKAQLEVLAQMSQALGLYVNRSFKSINLTKGTERYSSTDTAEL